MKAILAATDYSKEADNALEHAIGLAKAFRAKLILFHAYRVPVPPSDTPAISVSLSDIESDNVKAIKKIERRIIRKASGKIHVESYTTPGFPVQEILNIIKTKKPDLVVTGIKGAGRISEAFIGSTATSLMKATDVPVLAVPLESRFRKAKKIVLAYDYKKAIKKHALQKIRELAGKFKAQVLVLNVVDPRKEPGGRKVATLVKLKNVLRGIKYSFFFPAAENIVDEINEFVAQKKAHLVVMMPHKYAGIEKLLHPSNTKHMAFHTHVPLLSIHD